MRQTLLIEMFLCIVPLVVVSCQPLYTFEQLENPSSTFQESDLLGSWQATYNYDDGNDYLIFQEDGTFRQHYESADGYVYDSGWSEWWLERFPDGRVRVHLPGAIFYHAGVRGSEPLYYHLLYDPYADYAGDEDNYWVEMAEELVLNVRLLPSGEYTLAHCWFSSSWGFESSQLFLRADSLP